MPQRENRAVLGNSRRPSGVRRRWAGAGLRRAAAARLVEPEILGLRELIQPGDVCFDIGAAYGMFSYPLAELVGPDGAVHSFEPQRKGHALLSLGRALTGNSRITLTRSGVGAETGHEEIALPVKFGLPIHGHAHLVGDQHVQPPSSWHSWTRRLRIPVTTVDEVCAERKISRVHFMKIDVEGFEPGVIRGAANVIERDEPTLLLEIEDRHLSRYDTTAAEFSRSLLDRGYVMHRWSPAGWVAADEVVVGVRNYLFAVPGAWERVARPAQVAERVPARA